MSLHYEFHALCVLSRFHQSQLYDIFGISVVFLKLLLHKVLLFVYCLISSFPYITYKPTFFVLSQMTYMIPKSETYWLKRVKCGINLMEYPKKSFLCHWYDRIKFLDYYVVLPQNHNQYFKSFVFSNYSNIKFMIWLTERSNPINYNWQQ